jgi:quercetin dioxygenase-like cupin family protein
MRRLIPVGVALCAVLGWAQDPGAPVVRKASEVDWKASGSLPPGAEYHLIHEDPATHAVQTLVRMPRGYALPPHSHTHDETIVVLRGKLELGFGERRQTIGPGGYAVIPGGTVFTLKTGGFGATEFLAAFSGPFDMKAPPAK